MKPEIICAASLIVITATSCSKSDAAATDSAGDVASNTAASSPLKNAVPVAQVPANACGWISQQEVESIIGQLAGPPESVEGACRYTLPIPPGVIAERQKYVKTMDAISKMPGAEPMKKKEWDPYAIDLSVNS